MMKFIFLSSLVVLALAGCGGGGGGGSDNPPVPTYTLRGSFLAEAGNRVDSDVNDTLSTEPLANDDFAAAQPLGRLPVAVGGYLNQAEAGPAGRSFADGDLRDVYLAVNMGTDDVVRLALPDDADAAIDLALFTRTDTGTPRAFVSRITRNAAVTIPAPGSYFIRLSIVRGATVYRLFVGETSTVAAFGDLSATAPWVAGEVLVKLHPRAAASTTAAAFAADAGMRVAASHHGTWMRLRTTDFDTTFQRLHVTPRRRGAGAQEPLKTLDLIQALARDPRVAYAEPNCIRRPLVVPDDPLYPLQWNLDMINLPAAWDISLGRRDVVVAVVDTGVVRNHPDLKNKLVAGYDFISDPSAAADGDGVDDDADDPGDDAGGGSSFHGTHVAGIVAAQFNNGLGVAGTGANTRLMPVRVLGRDGGNDADIANGILWAAGIDVTIDGQTLPGASPPADIINLSLGGEVPSLSLCDAIAQARAAGAIVVAAAGNSASSSPIYPAGCDGVVSVSAVGANALPAPYTNFGKTIDLCAPGGNVDMDGQPDGYVDGVLSTRADDTGGGIASTYGYAQGTSMAAPHVAGVAALMKAERPQLTPDEFQAWLETGLLTGMTPFDHDPYYGYGLIDASAAVCAAQGDPPTVLSVAPQFLDFGHDTVTLALHTRKTGGDDLTLLDEDRFSVPKWLRVVYADNQPDRLGRYTVRVDRSVLSGGIRTGAIRLNSSVNAVAIPVRVAVLPDPAADAGTQYLQLIDAASGQSVAQAVLRAKQGRYDFFLENVSAGTYYLVSGSDLNNDLQISDPGEAVGGHPSLAGLTGIDVQANRTGLRFVTGFSQRPFLHPLQASRMDVGGP
jgi:serine protease